MNSNVCDTAPAIDLPSGEERARCDLGGQRGSTASAKDGTCLAVAIENERREGADYGRVGQMPVGDVMMVELADGLMECATPICAAFRDRSRGS